MKPARGTCTSLLDFSNTSKGLETISTIAMAATILMLGYKTVLNFIFYDYAFLFFMGVWYYMVREKFHVVPQHQVPTKTSIKNVKEELLNKSNIVSGNCAVQKWKKSSRTVPVQPVQSPNNVMEEITSNESENMFKYHELCQYFEKDEHEICQKKAHLALDLIKCGFSPDKAIEAANNCHNFESAFTYLTQKCDSCSNDFSLPEIIPMLMCLHKFCKSCTKNHFTKVIEEGNILKCTCQICEMPELEDVDDAIDYLSNIGKDLATLLPRELCITFNREFESGNWKAIVRSKQQHRNIGNSQTNPVKLCDNASVSNTGVVTRSRAQGKIYDRNDQISEPTTSAPLYSNHFTTNFVPVTPMEATATTSGNNNNRAQTVTGTDNKALEQLRLEQYFNSSKETCSFCTVMCGKTYKMINCEHQGCISCVTFIFTDIIRNKDVIDCVCTLCFKPQLQSKEEFFKYFESFRTTFRVTLNMEVLQLFEEKFKNYVKKVFGEDNLNSRSYTIAKQNDQENYNQLQTSCNHQITPDSQVYLCEHPRCLECVNKVISSKNILELMCDICYKHYSREAKLEFMNNTLGFNITLRHAVSPKLFETFSRCLTQNISASGISDVNSVRNSVNDYVEQSQTTCPQCMYFCDLTRMPNKPIKCPHCRTYFCGTCKAWYWKRCERNCFIRTNFHLHHKDVCDFIQKKKGFESLESILKRKKVNFVKVESRSNSCIFREIYGCNLNSFHSGLCKYHYEDYLANLILKHCP